MQTRPEDVPVSWSTTELLYDLELARLNNDTVFIPKLENINASEKVIEIDSDTAGSIFYLVHSFSHKIEDFQGVGFVIAFSELERNGWAGWIRIEIYQFCRGIVIGSRCFSLSKRGKIYSNK